ncbi:MAG: BtrH N-terminal domain-containing protein [Deltaproteobacteria bacterium]|nr:BtrH N-terminal domain-containing protein [Deltaproteobacteria bacterium]
MRNMLRFRGIDLSEPMCFGLGSGAGFLYVEDMPVPPFVTFHGRIMEMERELCDALALPFPEREEPDATAGWERAREAVAAGNPVVINTDLAYLEYFDTRTHFAGHRVVLFGFDDERGDAILSDSEREEPQRVPVESLKRSRSSDIPPYPMGNRWCVIAPSRPPRPIAEAIPLALRKNATEMLSFREGDSLGIAGMRKAAAEITGWPGRTGQWIFAARFGYQVIEKRGTGGGFFRRLYARYLEEASATHPEIAAAGLPGAMTVLADRWTEIAGVLKEISESGDASRLRDVSALLLQMAPVEESFWKKALEVSSKLRA